jgi:D-amino-acid dehydrogenase
MDSALIPGPVQSGKIHVVCASIAVIGGGITGVTTAYALARRGLDVTLLERHRYPAMETSFANGGQLSASNGEAWNSWSTVRKGLAWMLRSDAPLLVNPLPSWHKLSWLAEFLAAIPHYESNTVASARLAIAARQHLFGWAREEGIQFDQRHAGILHVCRDKAGFEHAARVSALLAQGGLQRRAVTPQEMRAIEPTLEGRFYGGFLTESDSTGDIHKYTCGLAQAAQARGARMVYGADVLRLEAGGSGVRVVYGSDGREVTQGFGALIVCAGAGSRAMAAMLGDRVNVYPVKGYSITVMLEDAASRAAAPTVSLVDDAAKLVASRLGANRFRVAGTAEFNGYNRDIRADRIAPLVQWVEQCFPGVCTRQVLPWAGLRPMMPNLLPRVGRGKRPGVFYNTGHGHLGWTMSAATAEIIAAQVQQSLAPSPAQGRGPLAA